MDRGNPLVAQARGDCPPTTSSLPIRGWGGMAVAVCRHLAKPAACQKALKNPLNLHSDSTLRRTALPV